MITVIRITLAALMMLSNLASLSFMPRIAVVRSSAQVVEALAEVRKPARVTPI